MSKKLLKVSVIMLAAMSIFSISALTYKNLYGNHVSAKKESISGSPVSGATAIEAELLQIDNKKDKETYSSKFFNVSFAGSNKVLMQMIADVEQEMETNDIRNEKRGTGIRKTDTYEIIPADYRMFTQTPLNVRDNPTSDGEKIKVLPTNTEVHVVGTIENNSYVQIETDIEGSKYTAFVSADYLGDTEVKIVKPVSTWQGPVLNAKSGTVVGPSGKETYYNLNMSRIVANTKAYGIAGDYHVSPEGYKMFGEYVMVAANLNIHPRYSVIRTSVSDKCLVVDTGEFTQNGSGTQVDIAVVW